MGKALKLSVAFIATSLSIGTPAFAEYQIILKNVHRIVEGRATEKARKQGLFVSKMTSTAIEVLASITFTPQRVRNLSEQQNRSLDAVSSSVTKQFSKYVGDSIGTEWQRYAEQQFRKAGIAEIEQREPEIRARYNAGRARIARETDWEAKRNALAERKARTYGPPKPNAFY